MLAPESRPVYASDECEVDLARRELRVLGAAVPVGGRAFEIMELLVRSAGELVAKDELMGRIWPGAIVLDNTLQVHIASLRRALGPYGTLLKTESGRGYRLLGQWTIRQDVPAPAEFARVLPTAQSPERPPQTNLPASTSDLIGRTDAVRRLLDLLSAYRIVTLTGPGGIGKTALALDVARRTLASFEGDVWLIELAPISNPDLVPSAVASVLNLKLGGSRISAGAVARAIREEKLLLILDNCEHVIDAAAELAQTMLQGCPFVSLLATSREALRIDGEYLYRVPPLDVPLEHQDADDRASELSAVELFITRTQALNSAFSANAENLRAIAAICRHLDGIPLAIEFAAARAATLGPSEVALLLNDRFDILTSGRRTALPRHQTLRAALDWSYELLPEEERRLLRHLAVFNGGFTMEAAAFVVNETGGSAALVEDGISNLVTKSLLVLNDISPVSRWRLLETIRTYALEKLSASGERISAMRRHTEYLRDLIVPATTSAVLRLSVDDVARYGREIDNIRTALDWSFSPEGDVETGIALTAAVAPAWLHLSLIAECVERAERALRHLDSGAHLAKPLERRLNIALGVALILTMGSVDRTHAVIARARTLAESIDDVEAQLRMLWAQWSMEFTTGECAAAQRTAQRFAEVAQPLGDEAALLVADRLLGITLVFTGDQRRARTLLEGVLENYIPPSNHRHTILFHYDQRVLARAALARVLLLQGFADQANEQARASLAEVESADPDYSRCWVLHYAVCPIAAMTGDIAAAQRAVATMIHLSSKLDAALWRIIARSWEGKLLIDRQEFQKGTELLRNALATCERTGWLFCYPEFTGMLAEGLAGLGRRDEALLAIDKALARANATEERWYVPELLRNKGELLVSDLNHEASLEAERLFRNALDLAEEQGARFWELRAALSLARLQVAQDRRNDARGVLAPVYNRFTEGFDTADLKEAKLLLDAL